jgi:hypothetical protein
MIRTTVIATLVHCFLFGGIGFGEDEFLVLYW